MPKLIAIGEALIDFVPSQTGCSLKEVQAFTKSPGGAPANVAACVAKLGGKAQFISKLGEDAFGDYLEETIASTGVEVQSVRRTKEACTGLAFVSLKENGERDFSFYRNPSADMLLRKEEISREWFKKKDILHFCSVDLIEAPVKYAHQQAIEYALMEDVLISFDPNVRLPLWHEPESCRETIKAFIPYAHILKISDEELSFITGIDHEDTALATLFQGNVKMIIYTLGKAGVRVITKKVDITVQGYSVNVIDTTGAGDSFIGAFLYQMLEKRMGKEIIEDIGEEELRSMLQFANGCAAIVVGRTGVINSLPSHDEVMKMLLNHSE